MRYIDAVPDFVEGTMPRESGSQAYQSICGVGGAKSSAAIRGISAKIVLHSSLPAHHAIYSCIQKTMSIENASGSTSVTWESHRKEQSPPDLRFLHFNDVYHVEYAAPRWVLLFSC